MMSPSTNKLTGTVPPTAGVPSQEAERTVTVCDQLPDAISVVGDGVTVAVADDGGCVGAGGTKAPVGVKRAMLAATQTD
jgi:hypothetical protein